MKKIISFEKKIEFPSMIGEVTAISLEHDLKFIDETNIEGMLVINGTYKLTEASMIEEPFSYEIPAEILLNEKLDINSSKIEIDDFYYEIENDYNLITYIDIRVEGVELVDIDESNSKNIVETIPVELQELDLKVDNIELSNCDDHLRECDGEIKNMKSEENKEKNMVENKETTVTSIFENINESEETYSTYSVYILREEETIQSLISKYKTTKEELEKYNDITNLTIGTKIIIPINE